MSSCVRKFNNVILNRMVIGKLKTVSVPCLQYGPRREKNTKPKTKTVLPRPLQIKYQKLRKPPQPQKVQILARESEMIDPQPKHNVYKRIIRDTIEDKALLNPDYFSVKEMIDIPTLFHNRAHFGHHFGCRNPLMHRYLYGCRQGIDIINLNETLPRLHLALNFVAHVVYRGGIVLFISRNSQHITTVETTASRCGEYSHCRYWKGGLMTNSESMYHGVTRLPDVVIFIHTLNSVMGDHIALTECCKMLIPTVAILDSNCDPTFVNYHIPANDDTPSAVQLYCKLFESTILKAKEFRKRDGLAEEEEGDVLINTEMGHSVA